MSKNQDTQPNFRPVREDVGAPPRLLLYGVVMLCVVIVAAPFATIWAFQEVLSPAQRQRVIDQVPFFERFLDPTPQGGSLPTLEPDDESSSSALDLLNMSLEETEEAGATQQNTPAGTPESSTTTESESVSVLVPTSTSAAPPTATASQTPTVLPTNTPTAAPTSTPEPVSEVNSAQNVSQLDSTTPRNTGNVGGLPGSARLTGFTWARQTWNNCGPATITTALSYYGWQENQAYAADYLKPYREDKNVGPDELAQFVNDQTGVRAMYRVGGNLRMLKALIANNIPVVIERGIFFEAEDWLGHYQTIVAYDDTQQMFYMYDTYLGTGDAGEGVSESYASFDEHWREFNRTFIVIYQEQDEGRIRDILGDLVDPQEAAQIAFETAQAEAEQDRNDAFAWFNMGSSLTMLGRYREATNAFDQSRRTSNRLPWRLLWYRFEPFEAYYNEGRYEEVLSLAQSNLNQASELEESYYWRGRVYAARGETNRAAEEFRRALRFNPNYEAARAALDSL